MDKHIAFTEKMIATFGDMNDAVILNKTLIAVDWAAADMPAHKAKLGAFHNDLHHPMKTVSRSQCHAMLLIVKAMYDAQA